MDLHSRGTRGITQSRNAWVYAVEERVGLHSRGTPWDTPSRNTMGYTVEGRQGIHSRGTPENTQSRNAKVSQSRNAWVNTVEERVC